MILVERCIELRILKRMLDECAPTGRQVALVAGPGGAGKTTLLSAFAEYAKGAGALVLGSSGARSEQGHHFGVLGQMYRSIGLGADREERLEGILASRHVDSGDYSPGADVLDELAGILLEAADGRPLVLTVDDMQYADPASLRTLLLILRRLASSPVVTVFAEWRTSSSQPPVVLAECIKEPYFQLLNVEPFSLGGVSDWLRQRRLGEAAVERLAPSFLAATGGSPLLLQALYQDHLHRPGEPGSVGVERVSTADEVSTGAHFDVAVEACLHRWDPRLLDVARGLAVLGGPASTAVLVRLLDGEHRAVAEALSALTDTGLLRSGWFRHPAARAAALRGLDGKALALLHERTALLLHHDGAVPSKVAERLVSAGGTAAKWSVDVLRGAARQVMGEGDPGRAAEFLEAARRASGDDQERAAVTGALARVSWLLKPSAVTSLLGPLNSALEGGNLDDRSIVMLSTFLAWEGRAEEAAAVLARVDARQYEFDLAGAAELTLARQWLRWVSPLKGTDRADEAMTPNRARAVACHSWNELVKSAQQVLECCRLTDALPVTVLAALLALTYDNRLDEAQRWCETLGMEAEAHQAATWVAILAAVQGLVAIRRGDLIDAELHSRRALTVMPQHNWGAALGLPLSSLVHATTAMGRMDEAQTLVKEALSEVHQNPLWLQFLRARGRFYLEGDRPYAALADLQACGRFLARCDLDHPNFIPWRSDLAEAWLRLGDPLKARAVIEKQLTLANVEDKRVYGCSLRIMAATMDLPARVSLLRDAVKVLFESGDQLELAMALADASDAELECGRFAESRPSAHQAKKMAKFCGAEPLYWRLQNSGGAEDDADEAAAPRRAPYDFTSLSEAERKVAALAAQGRSNREISRTLFITVSTVEQHLTKVYRKLRVSRRSNLPVELYLVGSADR
ncbi:AAA family ATPase [Streptomyces sp. NBC_00838]|uniref:AAA family ATPase n=1 Tax=Streptomyces sp. NBC_00838 TaxID=2903680 RepID=UPI003867D02F|nr:AAA family ATPase [Streptomyces sp. NBC_00838]